jgi:hypothetical protein
MGIFLETSKLTRIRVLLDFPQTAFRKFIKKRFPPFGGNPLIGGETGIRTLGSLARTTVFETAPFDRSGISPLFLFRAGESPKKKILRLQDLSSNVELYSAAATGST